MIFGSYFKKIDSKRQDNVHSPFRRFSRYPALKTDVRSWAATAGDCCAPGKSKIKQPQCPLPCFVFDKKKKHIQVPIKLLLFK